MEKIIVTKEEYEAIIEHSKAASPFWDKVGIRFLESFEVMPNFKLFVAEKKLYLGKTLDVACGAGRNLLYLLERGIDVFGFDISKESILYAQKEAGKKNKNFQAEERIQNGTMYDLRGLYAPVSFDTVIACFALYENKYKGFLVALNELTRCLKNGGMLYCTMRTEAKIDPEKVKEIEKGKGYITLLHKYNKLIRVYFQSDSFVELVENMGFSSIKCGPEFDYGARKNSKAREFIFKRDSSKKKLEIIVER